VFTITYNPTRAGSLVLSILLFTGIAIAQQAPDPAPDPVPATPMAEESESVAPATVIPPQQDKRIFGVLPNYRTTEASRPFQPLTPKQKFYIAAKDSFDWPNYLLGGAFACLYQLEDSNPSFGQGMKGYAHRYVTAYADQVIGNMLTEGALPALLREDPRYYRIGEGGKWHRAGYAATRIFVTHTDKGSTRFNTSEVLGNGITAAIANAYYPDNRSFSDTMQRLYIQLATDSFSNVLKEFWPDIKRKYWHKPGHGPSTTGD